MSAADRYIRRINSLKDAHLTPEEKSDMVKVIIEHFKRDLEREVQQTLEPYIINGDRVSKVYTVKGKNEFKLPFHTIESAKAWVDELLRVAEDGSVITIEVSEPVKKYSLWKHEASESVFMFNGKDYLCVDGGKYSSWKIGEVLLSINKGRLVPLEGK